MNISEYDCNCKLHVSRAVSALLNLSLWGEEKEEEEERSGRGERKRKREDSSEG